MSRRITVNEAAIQRLISSPAGPVARRVNAVVRQTANRARILSPVDKGLLRNSVHEQVTVTGYTLTGRVYDDAPYARYVHQGTRYMRGRPFLYQALQEVSPWPVRRL